MLKNQGKKLSNNEKRIELMAPAGDFASLRAAVQNGADAVYFGGRLFHARKNAGFSDEDVKSAVEYCHERGVNSYITLNTLVLDGEMGEALEQACVAYDAGADAVIVQDLGLASLISRVFPDLELHASTQCAVMNAAGARKAQEFGFSRVVLARECAFETIKAVCETSGIKAEVFCHGALCVAVSGQCLFSSMAGGRSGNRGMCAQPCRMLYDLGGKSGYWLSKKDLMTVSRLSSFIEAGVSSIKIEGRLKRPEYVAIVTRAYREAIDAIYDGRVVDLESAENELKKVFNRGGFTRGHAFGAKDGLIYPKRPGHCGIKVGTVKSVSGGTAKVSLTSAIKKGDGLESVGGAPGEGAGIVVQSDAAKGDREISVPGGVKAGDSLFRTTDIEQMARAAESYSNENRARLVAMSVRLIPDERACLRISSGGVECEVLGEVVKRAETTPLTEEAVIKQMRRMGEAPVFAESIDVIMPSDAFMQVSALNALRRDGIAEFRAEILRRARRYPARNSAAIGFIAGSGTPFIAPERPRLTVQCFSRELAQSLAGSKADEVALYGGVRMPFIWNETPASGHYAANWASVDGSTAVDYTLNVFNGVTADLLSQNGRVVTLSPELSAEQMRRIALKAPCAAVVYGRLPLMTLTHCPGRELAGSCKGCGERLSLRDGKGYEFPLLPVKDGDTCRTLLLNSKTLDVSHRYRQIRAIGLCEIRLIMTIESAEEAHNVIDKYRRLADGEADGFDPVNGHTTGHFFSPLPS